MSNYTKSALTKMTEQKLIALAMQEYGKVFDESGTKAEIIEFILGEQDAMEAEAKAEAEAAFTPKAVSDEADDSDLTDAEKLALAEARMLNEKCWLYVANSDEPGGDRPVTIQVNGQNVHIHRQKWVEVRKMFVLALDDCKMQITEQVSDGNGGRRNVLREVPRFNLQVRELAQGPGPEAAAPGEKPKRRFDVGV